MVATSLFKPLATLNGSCPSLRQRGIINKDLSLYHNMYQLKGGKQIKHFYDLPSGDKPTGIDASPKWFADINNSRDVRS